MQLTKIKCQDLLEAELSMFLREINEDAKRLIQKLKQEKMYLLEALVALLLQAI